MIDSWIQKANLYLLIDPIYSFSLIPDSNNLNHQYIAFLNYKRQNLTIYMIQNREFKLIILLHERCTRWQDAESEQDCWLQTRELRIHREVWN